LQKWKVLRKPRKWLELCFLGLHCDPEDGGGAFFYDFGKLAAGLHGVTPHMMKRYLNSVYGGR
jgi:hypothetical protein